ncbi:hypothetical protein MAXJ12_23302 [Mesorhizobium alhagi CCNWXJ12-2]|uniref:Uncharacterized protein n=1 Tax=Mesorhizobium alhagi CCNWXJ12-2 TaxID=1107882 RepID=H0HWV9_9HYPH|nr:hypothetical protein MAXJ12_23302 [Mesorhizobium alhagi CCNWXJ12-2]
MRACCQSVDDGSGGQHDDYGFAQTPRWQALPAETSRSVTKLMVSLILDHVDDEHSPGEREARHDA